VESDAFEMLCLQHGFQAKDGGDLKQWKRDVFFSQNEVSNP